jgi:hypothetical protein
LADRILALVPPGESNAGNRLDVHPARSVEVTRFVANVERMRQMLNLEPPDDPLFGLSQMVEQREAARG